MTPRRTTLCLLLAAAACGSTAPAPATPRSDPATTGTIEGLVRDRSTGAALSFATVTAALPSSGDEPERTETTDANGTFRLDGLAPGVYRIHVFYGTVNARWQEVEVTAGGRERLEIDLNLNETAEAAPMPTAAAPATSHTADRTGSRRGAIAGEVIDQATGEKLEGAVVAASGGPLRDAQMAVTNERGEFLIPGLPPGTYKLSCYYRLVDYGDVEIQRLAIEVAGGETTRVPLLLDTSATKVD